MENNQCWQGYGETGILILGWWEYETVHPLQKRVSFPKKLNIKLSDDSTVPLPDIYSKEMKTGTVRNTFT